MEKKEIEEKVNSKNNNLILKIVIGICIILVIVIICLVVFMNKDNTNNNNNGNSQINNSSSKINNNYTIQGKTTEELKNNSKSDVENLTNELESEWKTLSGEITTFDSYKTNKEKISNYYDKIVKNSEDFSIRICEYALKYGEIIVNSDKSFNDKYDELEDMYDYYYDGILDDAYDNVPYSDYSDISSAEYKNYSNARSDVYKAYSKARSDVYQFYSKLRSKIYSKDLDRAKEAIQDFSKDIDKLKNK